MIHYYYKNRSGWFRIFGFGLALKDTTMHELTFSERYGYAKGIKIGKWYIKYLPKPLKFNTK